MSTNRTSSLLVLLAPVFASAACVPMARYDLAVKNGTESERSAEEARTQVTDLTTKLDAAQKDNEEKSAKLGTYEQQTYEDSRRLADLEKRLTDLGATNNEVGERLRLASKSLGELATERRALTLAVADARACVEALAAARSRAAQTKPATTTKSAPAKSTAVAAPPVEAPELVDYERCIQKALAPAAPAATPAPAK